MAKFSFPEGSTNRQLYKLSSGYLAMWDDDDGGGLWELWDEDVEEYDYEDDDDEYGTPILPDHLNRYFLGDYPSG